MIKDALQYVANLAGTQTFVVDGKTYSTKQLAEVKPLPIALPHQVSVSTLRGLVDLIQARLEPAWIRAGDVYIHVNDYTQVTLNQKASDQDGRAHTFVTVALPKLDGFRFGTFIDHESFIIGLQANFSDTTDREYLLKIAANLTSEQVATSEDDGISQRVALKGGAVLKTSEVLRSRVVLAPFRTFREVEQPASEFVFRVRQEGEQVPKLALFEADGGKWKLDAVETIARYFRAASGDIAVIA